VIGPSDGRGGDHVASKLERERIRHLAEAVRKAAAGDYSLRIEPSDADDVTGDLARALNELFEGLQNRNGAQACASGMQEVSREVLSQSEARYRNILDSMEEAYFEVGFDGRVRFYNSTVLRYLGYTADEILEMHYRDLVDEENAEKLSRTFRQVFSENKPLKGFDWQIICKDGTAIPVESSVSLLRDANGKPVGFKGIVRDASERIRAEEALRESEERYRSILDIMEEGYLEDDLKGTVTFVNDAACRLMGYTREELVGMNYRQYTTPESARRLYEIYNRIYTTGRPEFMQDYEIVRKDGSIRVHQANSVLLRDKEGKPCGFRILARDVTDRKKAEDALRESEKRYRMIARNMHDTIWAIDFDMRFTYLSPSIVRLTGYTPEETQGRPMAEQMTPESHALTEAMLGKAVALAIGDEETNTDGLGPIELELVRKDGSLVSVEVTAAFNRDETGRAIGLVGTARDITERRQAEEMKARLESQLIQAQKMESIGRLAGGVAHDFNNMLSVILGYVTLIKMRLDDKEALQHDIQEIERAASRSRDITAQLLAFSRKQIITPRPMELNGLIIGGQKTLARLIGEDIELTFFPGEGLWKVSVDPSQMEQILINLAVNARDAMNDGGKLTIETVNVTLDEEYCRVHLDSRPGHYVLIAVSDNGVGMDRETLENIFEPFYTTKETGRGTGLGLAMVYGIVKQNGGFINVYSEPGQGTTFRIYLPRVQDGEGDRGERLEPHAVAGAGRILLVEDDELVRNMTADMLETMGYTVKATCNPLEALSLCEGGDAPFDLVITDVIMPCMSGRELRDRLLAVKPDTKVLFVSGYTSNVIVHHGVLEAGVHFLQKPFSMTELARRIREAMGGA